MRALAIALVLASALGGCELLPPSRLAQLPPAQSLPEPRGTYLNMGRHFLSRGQPDLAHDAFIRSLRVEGVSAAALTGAGIAAERIGLLTEAERFFEKAVRLAPSSVVAYNNLGAVQYRMGNHHEARQAFQTAFALSSGESAIAGQNLVMAERAIAQAENTDGDLEIQPNPVPLQRLGTGEYTLGVPETADIEG